MTKTWCINNNINPEHSSIDDEINMLFKYKITKFDIIHPTGGSGNEIHQSPIWVRPESLEKDCTEHIHVIGHTYNGSIEFNDNYINTDALPHEYVIIDTNTNEYYINKLV